MTSAATIASPAATGALKPKRSHKRWIVWTIVAMLGLSVIGKLSKIGRDIGELDKALNDALCLQGLNELSTMTVPLQSPCNWQPGPWTAELTTDVSCG